MGEGLRRARAAARATRAPARPKYQPPQVTLLQAAEALLARMEEYPYGIPSHAHGEAEVLRQAIQREKAK